MAHALHTRMHALSYVPAPPSAPFLPPIFPGRARRPCGRAPAASRPASAPPQGLLPPAERDRAAAHAVGRWSGVGGRREECDARSDVSGLSATCSSQTMNAAEKGGSIRGSKHAQQHTARTARPTHPPHTHFTHPPHTHPGVMHEVSGGGALRRVLAQQPVQHRAQLVAAGAADAWRGAGHGCVGITRGVPAWQRCLLGTAQAAGWGCSTCLPPTPSTLHHTAADLMEGSAGYCTGWLWIASYSSSRVAPCIEQWVAGEGGDQVGRPEVCWAQPGTAAAHACGPACHIPTSPPPKRRALKGTSPNRKE